MKKIVIYITSILFTLILGIFIGKLFFYDKKDTVISNNDLSNKKYILNIEGSSYIKFDNDKYEYRYKNEEESYYNVVNGTYTLTDNIVTLDNNISFKILSDELIQNDNKKLVYFDSNTYTEKLIKFKNVISNYVDDIKKSDANLAYPKNVKVDVLECFYRDNKFICNINYNIYFDNYIKSVCDTLERDKMFFPYAISNGTCESSYISNSSYFELEKKDDNYKLIKTYNNL